MAVVALSAPAAGAQDRQPTANGTRRGGGERRPARHPGRDRRAGAGGNAFDAAVAAASVLGVVEPYSCGIGGGGFMVFRDGKTGKISTLDSREKSPAAMVPSSFFIDGKAPTDAQFNINRYSGLSAGVPGTPYAWSYLLRNYGTYKLKDALAYGVKVARDGFTVDKTFFDQTTPNVTVLRRHPVDGGDLPRRRRHAEGRRHGPPQPRHGQDLRAHRPARRHARASTRGAVADAIVKAATAPPTAPTADHTWRPGLLDQSRSRALPDEGPRARSSSTTSATTSTAWARRPRARARSPRR